ncbi:MAG: DNA primase, partial [Candidatus Aerophobetes bacterium]|nr:DNA primase [Candidatus Aerophobetes bacterium]
MGGYISDEIINKISEQADIVQIISEYLPLKKAGKNYKALCPFHEERTPSFMVSGEKQLFHCFGCGVGGNVFTFLMKWEKISFPEAVKILGEKLGISVSIDEEKKGGIPREKFYQINESVVNFFQRELRENKAAQDYLKGRGFTEETLDTWKLGYAPHSRVFLSFCKEKGFSFESLKDLGLLSQREGDWYAYFRDRIIFPIFTPQGKVCGFGGRVLGDGLPKYLNSPQSPLFDKGRILYGLNFSKEAIGKEKAAVLVEGYTDAVTLYQGGMRNVVASLGT